MLVSCCSRSPGESTVSWMRWGPLGIALAALLAGAPRSAGAAIHALSSDPRLVSGGDVLVQVDAPREDASISIDLNGHDITGEFRRDRRTGALIGLVGGLTIGENTLSVSGRGVQAASLVLTNYPITGPITSGPHIKPVICQTQEFVLPAEGFGCPGGWYIQGPAEGNLPGGATLLDLTRLGEGYATFENTLQHPANNCNAVLQAETAMMSKEHFIKTYGVPRYTVSAGCSGGSYTSLQIADNLPGMFQGVFISCTFPDPDGIAFSGMDGHLLTHYFTVTNPNGFSSDQQVAVSGYEGVKAWYDAANQAGRTDPVPGRIDVPGYNSAPWSSDVPVSERYDPVSNPTGARPTVFDWQRNAYGLDPETGFARRPFDNVGVQYGLQALNAGAITTTQFLHLNQGVGGYDVDDNYIASRTSGDLQAVRRTYESGLQLYGGAGLASIPVFDLSGLVGVTDSHGYHYQWFHFATRQRMIEANGNGANHVMWRGNAIPTAQAWQLFIQWVENVRNDGSEANQRTKVIRDKPAGAVDGCWPTSTQFVAEPQTFSRSPDSQCNTVYPSFAFPRFIAGGPLAADIIKGHLEPPDPRDYQVALSSSEL